MVKNRLQQNVSVHVDKPLTLPPPCGQTWFFRKPPLPPLLSTWFMDAAKDTGEISKNICQNGHVCQNNKCPISFGYSADISCCTKSCNKTEIQILNPNGKCCRRTVFSFTSREISIFYTLINPLSFL